MNIKLAMKLETTTTGIRVSDRYQLGQRPLVEN